MKFFPKLRPDFLKLQMMQTTLCTRNRSYTHIHVNSSLLFKRFFSLQSGPVSCQHRVCFPQNEQKLFKSNKQKIWYASNSQIVSGEQTLPPDIIKQKLMCAPDEQMILSATNEQKVLPPNEEWHWINSPRSFYMQSTKYPTLTYELLPQIKSGASISTTDEMTFENKTLQTANFFYSNSASETEILEYIKELNMFPKKVVQEQYSQNRDVFRKALNSLTSLNDEILKEYFIFFAKLNNIKHEIEIFEKKCCDNIELWSVDTVLLVCDAFHIINYHALSFNKKMYEFMGKHIHLFSKDNIVQFAYLVGENRKVASSLMLLLQKRMLSFKADFTVTEIGAICNGFFKSQTQIKSTKLLTQFSKSLLLEDLRSVDSHSLVGICKMYRYAYFGSEKLFNKLASEIVERIPTMRIEVVTHIALTYSTLRMFHAPLMDTIAEVYVRKIKYGRCKDVTKCLWSMSTLAHVPTTTNQFYNTALTEIRQRLVEYLKHPSQLTSALLALAYVDVYPLDVIDYAFSTTFLSSVKKYKLSNGIDLRPDLYLLHSALSIDRPLYCGNKLPKDFLIDGNLPDDLLHTNVHQELDKKTFLKPVFSCISEILGNSQLIKPCFILPHMKTLDLELRLSTSGEPIPVSEWDLQNERSSTKKISERRKLVQQILEQCEPTAVNLDGRETTKSKEFTSTRVAIVLWSRNHYRFGAKENIEARCLLGLHTMKKRHLLLLGYKLIELPFYELENDVDKEYGLHQYLREKLMEIHQMRSLLQHSS